MHLTISTKVLFIRSATPFCCGDLGIVSSCLIPLSLRYPSNSSEVNSPPLSVRKHLTLLPNDFSTKLLKPKQKANSAEIREQESSSSEEVGLVHQHVFAAGGVNEPTQSGTQWIIDTGATSHICSDRSLVY